MDTKYKRVLLKLSGEALAGEQKTGINQKVLDKIVEKIKIVYDAGVEIAIVVGGGNFWRGRTSEKMDRTRADQMGMLATVINSLGIADALENAKIKTAVYSAVEMGPIAERFVKNKAVDSLKEGKIVVFAAGTGNPFFSTDTTAALRAAEIDADVILLAKNVDGVYDSDPNINKNAVKFDSLSYMEVLSRDLKVMDSTATSLCMDNDIVIHVFGLEDSQNIVRAVCGEKIGTIVKK